ncbi:MULTISPECIES: RidA family protein [Kordiimonas]|jgi:enamine deaminase RidA (YjgF/YER057c/UK114 family)|uniref:Enamine deaminase RidA, house cleaning of reactive enamine intermediates, YjgF/YER057c/UK114 family n=1 Tax=Kordiimonas lacus TaxID=637679 RepID=A0A1G7C3B5_9PROT|nr:MULTISPECIES: RidA family protein [Kordiimonas]SDE33801.1 Enamine deaminase RidA, house cleaning of reactive enamine intermediates, YjgF/YER057c/UK114 family [Kordiimonas lacus]
MSIEARLNELGIDLPTPVAPVANYVPFVRSGNLVSISGQIPMQDGKLAFEGKVGDPVSEDDAKAAARLCGINLIAQMKAACDGDLDRVVRVVKLGGFVNCTDGFGGQPQIINAASDLMVEVFGDKGRHSRSAVGVNALPLNVPVEIDALVEIRD